MNINFKVIYRQLLLALAVTISGASVMVIELLGVRILAPYVGTSLYVWTSMIGVVLGCLTIGYYIGGRLADTKVGNWLLPIALTISAVLVVVIGLSHTIMLAYMSGSEHIIWDSLRSSFLFFGPLNILLGMVLPLAVNLKHQDGSKVGNAAGTISAVSTIGSITGTFLAGFWLIPNFGITTLLFMVSGALLVAAILTGAISFKYKKGLIVSACLIALLLPALLYTSNTVNAKLEQLNYYLTNIVDDINTPYRRVIVWEYNESKESGRVRVLGDWQSTAYLKPELRNQTRTEYLKYYRLAEYYNPNFKHTMLIGGAGYSFPRLFLNWYPGKTLDVVEIDPKMEEIAKEHFFYKPDPRIRSFFQDGRTYMQRTTERYDVIYMDAYSRNDTIPHHLITTESFSAARNILNDDGIVILNLIGSATGYRQKLFRAVYNSMAAVFPTVKVFFVKNINENGNIIFIGSLNSKDFNAPQFAPEHLKEYLKGARTFNLFPDVPPLTDDFAPVEDYSFYG